MFWLTLITVVVRFVLLLVGTAGVAYWAAIPGHHPVSAAVSPMLLLAYLLTGELSKIPGHATQPTNIRKEGKS